VGNIVNIKALGDTYRVDNEHKCKRFCFEKGHNVRVFGVS